MSDTEYMSVKQFEGKILKSQGSVTSAVELTSVVPASGKTFYLHNASAMCATTSITNKTSTTEGVFLAEVRNNTVAVDHLGAGLTDSALGTTDGFGMGSHQKSDSIIPGESLVGDGAKKYSIQVTAISATNTTVKGTIYGFIEDDADDPRL